MTFKMIREAQLIAKLGVRAARAQEIKNILGVDSITSISEVFDATEFEVTPQHYQQWLQTIMQIAQERSVSLGKRQNFNDIAFEILNNDSLVDALGGDAEKTKSNILKALWQAYKVNQAHSKVQDHVSGMVDKAREDEEAAAGLAGADDSGFSQAFSAAKGVENEEQHSSRIVRPVFQRALKKGKTNPYPAGSLRAALWNDAHNGVEDEEFDDIGMDTQDAASEMPPEEVDSDSLSADDLAMKITGAEGGEGDIESKIDDLEARVAELEAGEAGEHDEMGDDEMADQGVEADPEMDEPTNPTLPTQELNDTEYDEEEQVKSLFMKALTSPKEKMTTALKSVEDEGSKAWLSMMMPKNPHPPKSPAHAAWAKGFKNSVKTGMGFDVKPREPAKKKKK